MRHLDMDVYTIQQRPRETLLVASDSTGRAGALAGWIRRVAARTSVRVATRILQPSSEHISLIPGRDVPLENLRAEVPNVCAWQVPKRQPHDSTRYHAFAANYTGMVRHSVIGSFVKWYIWD
jgi:hypothetical protein